MAKKPAPIWVKWYPKDALDGMQALDVCEELAYRRIIDLIYTTNGQLPDDDKRLARMTKVGRRWKKVKKTLIEMGKIEVVNGLIVQQNCARKLDEWNTKVAHNKHRKALKNNKTGVTERKPNGNRNASTRARAKISEEEKDISSTSSYTENLDSTDRPISDIDSDLSLYTQQHANGHDPTDPDIGRGDAATPTQIGDEVQKAMDRVRSVGRSLKKIS